MTLTEEQRYKASVALIKQASKLARQDLDKKDIWTYKNFNYIKNK